jgi:hypothetical protein
MPKPLTPISELAMQTLDIASLQHMAEPATAEPHNLMEHLSSEPLLVAAAATLLTDSQVLLDSQEVTEEVVTKGIRLVKRAREQSWGLLDAAWKVLPARIPREEVAEQLRNSRSLGRVFGLVSREPSDGRDSNDEKVLRRIIGRPHIFLAYSARERSVGYSEQGRHLLRLHINANAGCPALNHTLPTNQRLSGRPDLFDIAWEDFTEGYIAESVRRRGVAQQMRRVFAAISGVR